MFEGTRLWTIVFFLILDLLFISRSIIIPEPPFLFMTAVVLAFSTAIYYEQYLRFVTLYKKGK